MLREGIRPILQRVTGSARFHWAALAIAVPSLPSLLLDGRLPSAQARPLSTFLLRSDMSDAAKIGAALTLGTALGAAGSTLYAHLVQHRALHGAATSATAKPLPKLYIYDHCPFCVRARMIFGLKHVPHELVFLANHDEATPIGLVGSKQAPILAPVDGKPFPESMDIVRYVDEHYGGGVLLQESANREDLKLWIQEAWPLLSVLYYPRIHAAPFPEFAQHESREYFRVKKEKTVGPFSELRTKTPETVAKVNKLLEKLATILNTDHSVNDAVSYDDIDLFGRLRSLTLVKDVTWPVKVRAYVDHFSKAGDIPLLDAMAEF